MSAFASWWSSLTFSASSAIAGIALLAIACIGGAISEHRHNTNRRNHERTRGEHWFRNVSDPHYRAWK